jgi:ABC-type nitrate/sulfonate/bicarbonate transport system substrate-binding protein
VYLADRGEAPFFTSVSTTIEAVQRDWADVVAVASNGERPFFALVRDGIDTIADLHGKRVMTGGGASRNEITHLATGQGWHLGTDLHVVRGDATDRMRAFEDPNIDAVAGRIHYLAWARKAGFHPLTYPAGATWFEGGLGVTRRFLQDQPEAVAGVVRALARADAFIHDPANRDECIATLDAYIRYLTPTTAAEAFDIHRDYYSLYLDAPGMQYMAEVLAVAKQTAASWTPDHLDTTFLAAAGARRAPGARAI